MRRAFGKNIGRAILFTSVMAVGLVLGFGCSNGSTSSSSSSANSYVGTASHGDVWTWNLNRGAGVFTGTSDAGQPSNAAAAFTISGSLQVLSSGYLKLTVATTSGAAPSIPIDGSHNIAYALEVPQVALIVQPPNGMPVIVSVYNSGNCNALSGSGFNYVRTGFGSSTTNIVTTDAYGAITLNGTSAAPGVSGGSSFNIAGGTLTFNAPGTGACTNGVISFPGNVKGAVTSASGGIMMLDFGLGNGGVVIFGGNGLAPTDIAGVSFNGVVFRNNSSSTTPIRVVFDGSSVGTVYGYSAFEAGTVGSATNMIKSLSGSGSWSGTVFDADGVSHSSNMHAIVQKVFDGVQQRYVILMVAQDAAGTAPMNILLVQK